MKLYELIKIIEEKFPPALAMEWDNVGLLVGDREREVQRVLLTLDVTEETVREALYAGCDLILSHHPILFSPAHKITAETAEGRLILSAIENKIAIYAAHTNCDVAECGINARLAELFGLENAVPLEENGLGRIGDLPSKMSFSEFCAFTSKTLKTPLRTGGEGGSISRVAIGSGACADSIPTAILKGADVMITADLKYHEMLNFAGFINIIDAGHYPTEIIVTDIFEELLAPLSIEAVRTTKTDIFKFHTEG